MWADFWRFQILEIKSLSDLLLTGHAVPSINDLLEVTKSNLTEASMNWLPCTDNLQSSLDHDFYSTKP